MTAKTELQAPKRRTRAEVQQLVAEFVSSEMRRSEFRQRRGLSFSTLHLHLKTTALEEQAQTSFFGWPVGEGGVGGQGIVHAPRGDL